MSIIHSGPSRHARTRQRRRAALAILVSGALAASVALANAPAASAADATSQTVQFESIAEANGLLDDNGSLTSGVDYQNGDNGGGSVSQNQLKTENNNGGRTLSGVTTGAWVRYRGIDLGASHAVALQVTYDAPTTRVTAGKLEIHVDSVSAAPLTTVTLANTGSGWGTYTTTLVDLPPTLTGSHDLYLKFVSTPDSDHPYVGNFDSFTLLYVIDTVGLNAAITSSAPLAEHPDWYPTATFQTFSAALSAATTLAADSGATYTQVEAAKTALQQAVAALRWTIIDQLSTLVNQARQVRQADVTASSWATLQSAVSAAQALSPSTSSHAAYEQAYSDLDAAYTGLVAMSSSQTVLTGVPASADEGTAVTFEVSVTSGATGTVHVTDGGEPVADVALGEGSSAQVSLSGLGLGTHVLTAAYDGDGSYLPSVSDPVTVEIVKVVPVPVTATAPTLSRRSQVYGAAANGRVTLTTTVSGATAGTVTFLSGSKTLGSAAIVRSGSAYKASLVVAETLAVGSYGTLKAVVRASDGRTVTSAAASATFKVVKAKISKVSLKTSKKVKKHHKTTVKVTVSKKLSNGRAAAGTVRVYVGKKLYKHVSVSSVLKRGGTVKITLPKRFAKGKKFTVKASFVPSAKSGVATTSVKKTVKVKK